MQLILAAADWDSIYKGEKMDLGLLEMPPPGVD
jgi:hypothetical protein